MAFAEGSTGNIKQFNVLYVILTLKNHSDRKHPLTEAQILEHLLKDYSDQYGVSMNRSTLTRMLNALEGIQLGIFRDKEITEITSQKDLNLSNGLSFYLRHIENDGSPDLYYYESVLLESELKTLYDAIETYNYFCVDDIQNISCKLSSLRPLSKDLLRYLPFQTDEILKEDNMVLQNINELADIIKNHQLAIIKYGYYNDQLKLVIKKGYPKIMRPLQSIWSNGFYYCIMGSKEYKNTINLRIDRILSIDPVKDTAPNELKQYTSLIANNEFNSKSEYRTRNPIMHSGRESIFHLLVNASANNMMNTIVDVFGISDTIFNSKPKKTVTVSTDTAQKFHLKDNGKGWVELRIKCAEPGMELFATEYCKDVIIVSPDASARRVRETLKEALGHYGV